MMTKNITHKITLVLLSLTLLITFSTPVYATPEEDLQKIQEELKQIEEDKKNINSQINQESAIQNELTRELTSLKNQIDLLESEIQSTELTIQEIQIQINLLEAEIAQKEIDMNAAKIEINDLEKETDTRIIEMYIEKKTSSEVDMIFSTSATNLVKLSSYHSSLQEETNALLKDLEEKKAQLDIEKANLEESKIQVSRDEITVIEKKVALEKDKASIDSQRSIYYKKRNESLSRLDEQKDLMDLLEDAEKKALADQTKLIQIISDSITQIPSGAYVTAGTIIGRQGCTGLCTGPHLHFGVKENGSYVNPCNVLEPNNACSGSSGSLEFPMKGSYVLTSGYGWRWGKFHYGIDVASYTSGAPIYAAHNGYLVYGNDNICANYSGSLPCNGAGANYAILCDNTNCNVGTKTMYWHLQ